MVRVQAWYTRSIRSTAGSHMQHIAEQEVDLFYSFFVSPLSKKWTSYTHRVQTEHVHS